MESSPHHIAKRKFSCKFHQNPTDGTYFLNMFSYFSYRSQNIRGKFTKSTFLKSDFGQMFKKSFFYCSNIMIWSKFQVDCWNLTNFEIFLNIGKLVKLVKFWCTKIIFKPFRHKMTPNKRVASRIFWRWAIVPLYPYLSNTDSVHFSARWCKTTILNNRRKPFLFGFLLKIRLYTSSKIAPVARSCVARRKTLRKINFLTNGSK